MKLTQHNISTIAVPTGKSDIFVWDDAIPGFALRVYAAGSRQWIFQYRLGSKQRRLSFGSPPAINRPPRKHPKRFCFPANPGQTLHALGI
jgi:hypothetical protein